MTGIIAIAMGLVCALAYWRGGQGDPNGLFYKMVKKTLVPIAMGAFLWAFVGFAPGLLATALLLGFALSVSDFGKWYWSPQAFAVVGAFAPYALETHHYLSLGLQAVALPLLVYAWSRAVSNDFLEESGRGFLISISCVLYLIK